MDFIKRYAMLLVPAGIVVVSIVLFVISILIGSSVQQGMAQSVSMADKVSSYVRQVPSASQWQVAQEYENAHASDANIIASIAVDTTRRELLSYDLFPDPCTTSLQVFRDFGVRYVEAVERLLERLDARDCPTKREIDDLLAGAVKSSGSRRGSGSEERDKAEQIRNSFYTKRAESIACYTNPMVFIGYKFWKDRKSKFIGKEEWLSGCWSTQMAYWIQEDIVETIRILNADSHSVFTSPVKRLLGISFASADGTGDKDDEEPMLTYVRDDYGLVDAWTGRQCDDDMDVVHFSIAVIISAKAEMPFMHELCSSKEHIFRGFKADNPEQHSRHNQITILEYSHEPIDRNDREHESYRYGSDAVIRLNLICEYFFSRKGYDSIKPETVKEQLGQLKDEKKGSARSRRTR
ncbi:MAG: hypothetical protein ABIG61_01170 [Planctomycetota bacterium]